MSTSHAVGRIAIFAIVMSASAHAQWTSDPALNTVIAARPGGEHVQPKIVSAPDGGFYVSHFDNAGGGYDVSLQRLSAGGVRQWGDDGLLVADRSFSSTQDYGLDIDPTGNAVLAFRLQPAGQPVRISVSKVSPAGVALWGAAGVLVSSPTVDANSPRVAATSDGGTVVAWSEGGALKLQKLDVTGMPTWGAGVTLTPPSGNFLLADLHAATNGDAIVAWQAQLSGNSRQLWAQKLASATGASLWAVDHVKVLDNSAGAMQFGYFPTFVHDGLGGAVFTQYVISGVRGVVRVQHVLAAGTSAFAQNGVNVSLDTSRRQYAPAGAFDPSSGDTYVIWRETDATQGQVGLTAQRLDVAGQRQWGDEGRMLLPLAAFDKTQLQARLAPGGVVFAWVENTSPSAQPIVARRLDAAGNPVWSPVEATLKTSASSVSRLVASTSVDGFLAFVWQDASGGSDSILRAQNLSFGGALGDHVFAGGFD